MVNGGKDMLDGGPSRVGRLTGRRSTYHSEPTQQPEDQLPEMPERMSTEPRQEAPQPQRQQRDSKPQSSGASLWNSRLISFLLIVLVGLTCWLVWSTQASPEDDMIEADKYQAVFLSNGQIYFGKLASHSDRYMKLTNVFYLERQLGADSDGQTELPSGDNSFQLLKYSDVLYGSEDLMVISRDDIIRYENLSPNGVVGRAIAERN